MTTDFAGDIRSTIERILFKKLELWLVLFLLLFSAVGAVLFGAIVRNETQGKNRFGKLGDFAYALASLPEDAKDALSYQEDNWMSVHDSGRFPGRQGWNFSDINPQDRPDGYVLHSRYDGDAKLHVVELVDLRAGKVEHRVAPSGQNIWRLDAQP